MGILIPRYHYCWQSYLRWQGLERSICLQQAPRQDPIGKQFMALWLYTLDLAGFKNGFCSAEINGDFVTGFFIWHFTQELISLYKIIQRNVTSLCFYQQLCKY